MAPGLAMIVLVVVVVVGACSPAPTPAPAAPVERADGSDVARLVGQDAVERFPELRVGVTTCPMSVEAVAGTSFTCTQEVEGVSVTYLVSITEVVDGLARYTFGPTEPVVDLGRVRSLVRSSLDEALRSATVDCGPQRLAVVAVGDVITCSVKRRDPALDLEVSVLVSNEEGTLVISETVDLGAEGGGG